MTTPRTFHASAAALSLLLFAAREDLAETLVSKGLPAPDEMDDESITKMVFGVHPVNSQGDLAAVYINHTHGVGKPLDPDSLCTVLMAGFPGAKIGQRHGPYYISKARTGQLKGLKEGLRPIPHAKRCAPRKATPPVKIIEVTPEMTEQEAAVHKVITDAVKASASPITDAEADLLVEEVKVEEVKVEEVKVEVEEVEELEAVLSDLSRADLVALANKVGVSSRGKSALLIKRIQDAQKSAA